MMKPIKKILAVCTGNSCRSVMAEAYLVKRLKENGFRDALIISSGTHATAGLPPTDETVDVLREEGMDASGYLTSPLNKIHIDNADIILVMEPMHKEKILNLSPDAGNKIHYLREFSPGKEPKSGIIPDPIGKPIEKYRESFTIIKDSVEGFIKWLKEKE